MYSSSGLQFLHIVHLICKEPTLFVLHKIRVCKSLGRVIDIFEGEMTGGKQKGKYV